MVDIPEENISPPGNIMRNVGEQYVKGMGRVEEEVKILLDVEKMLREEELQMISEIEADHS